MYIIDCYWFKFIFEYKVSRKWLRGFVKWQKRQNAYFLYGLILYALINASIIKMIQFV